MVLLLCLICSFPSIIHLDWQHWAARGKYEWVTAASVCVLLHPPTSTKRSAWGATNHENLFPLLYLVLSYDSSSTPYPTTVSH